ncbi:MAG TPA: hypothetical protein VHX19_04330 [Stellaceae bacterium]|jgi:hypothetical protein|nr:hypothetical protein [Stellaceae bacterium]
MAETGLSPDVLAKLEALEPRDELVMRIALRELHDSVRRDRGFGDRIKLLLEQVDPRPQEMAAIFAEAREAGKTMSREGTSMAQAEATPRPRHRNS